MREFNPYLIFTMEEITLFYQLEVARNFVTPAKVDVQGSKQSKMRVILALHANMDRFIKIKPVLIEKAKNPCPSRQTVHTHYVWYGSSTNAWMTTTLFNRFLSDFDTEM